MCLRICVKLYFYINLYFILSNGNVNDFSQKIINLIDDGLQVNAYQVWKILHCTIQ